MLQGNYETEKQAERIAGVVDSYSIWSLLSCEKDDKDERAGVCYLLEFETWSDLGENIICSVWVEGDRVRGGALTFANLAEALDKEAKNFDPDEHAAELVPLRGSYGVPDVTLRQLLEDAEDIKESYEELAGEIKDAADKSAAEAVAAAEALAECDTKIWNRWGALSGRDIWTRWEAYELELFEEFKKREIKNETLCEQVFYILTGWNEHSLRAAAEEYASGGPVEWVRECVERWCEWSKQ